MIVPESSHDRFFLKSRVVKPHHASLFLSLNNIYKGRAAGVNNVDGLFIETHFDPSNAKSDGANMLHIDHLDKLLTNLSAIRRTINSL